MSVPEARSGRRQIPADRCNNAGDNDSWAEFAMNALQEASMAHRQRRARRMSLFLYTCGPQTRFLRSFNGFGALEGRGRSVGEGKVYWNKAC
jgi:hypothetical protein